MTGSRRGRALSSALATILAVPIGAAAISSALSERTLDAGDALAAFRLNPLSADAASVAAATLVGEGRDAEAARMALVSVDAAAMNSDAVGILGYLRERADGPEAAQPLMEAAARLSWDNETAQLWMLQRASGSGRFDEASLRTDALLRQRLRREELFVFLRDLTLYPDALPPLAERLSERPKWRRDFLVHLMALSPENNAGHGALLTELRKTSAPPTTEEVNAFVARLIADGDYAEARRLWLQLSGGSDRGLLGDGRFRHLNGPRERSPFGWTVADLPGVSVRSEGVLRITASGRPSGGALEQVLVLNPGRYLLLDESREIEPGSLLSLAWRATCLGGGELHVIAQEPASAAADWRQRSHVLVVPPNCPAQRLELRLDHDAWRNFGAEIRRVEIRPL